MSSGLTVARQRRWRYVLPIVLTLLIAVLVFVWWRLPLAVSPADAWFLMKARGWLTGLAGFILVTAWTIGLLVPVATRSLNRRAAVLSQQWGLDMTNNAMDKYPQLTLSQQREWAELCIRWRVIRGRIVFAAAVLLTLLTIAVVAFLVYMFRSYEGFQQGL